MKRSIAVVAMLVVGFAATTCAQTGREIAQKVKDRPDGDTRRSEMVMTLINKRGACANASSFPTPSMWAKKRKTARASCSSNIPAM